ncbi:MAG: hypothetical protein NZ898_12015 [Myxococcota bacterium]|nr:hypothetical protein [Myxococcota bacterium]MDW8360921.1 hypothetical protein [Myxococcales bacterium]
MPLRPLAIAFAVLVGCVDHDGPTLIIRGNAAPDDECEFKPDKLVVRGIFDVGATNSYALHPVYVNQMRSRQADAPPRADPNGIRIEGAEVELRDTAGAPLALGAGLPNPYTVMSGTFVPSISANSDGVAVGELEVIPAPYAGALPVGGTVVIAVRVFGETLGGVDIESAEYLWPIDVCASDLSGPTPVSCLLLPPSDEVDIACCTCGNDFQCEVGAPACLLP